MKTNSPFISTFISILSLTFAALPSLVMIQTGEPMNISPWVNLFALAIFAVAWAALWHNLGTPLQENTT